MADTGAIEAKNSDDTSSSEKNEPNLHEIKAMLIDIQVSLSSVLLENKQFKKELGELKASLQLSDNELRDMKTKLDEAAKANTKHATTTSLYNNKPKK